MNFKSIMKSKIVLNLTFVFLLSFFVFLIYVQFIYTFPINLTSEEKLFIKNHNELILAPDPSFAPLEFFDENNEFSGISADYLKWIKKNTGLNVIIKKYPSWSKVIEATKNNRVDILGAVAKTENRENFLLFSESYISIPEIIVTRKEASTINNSDLNLLRVAVIKSSGTEDLVKEKLKLKNLILVNNTAEGLKNLSFGDCDVFIGSLAQVSYYIEKLKIVNLKVNKTLDFTYDMRFAFRKEYPLLEGIINKSLKVMPKKYKNDIYNKWISLGSSKSLIENLLFQRIIVVLLFITLFILIWSRSLKNQVKLNTKEILDLNEELKNELSNKELILIDIIMAMTNIIELYDEYTKGHSVNVSKISKAIALEYGLNKAQAEEIYLSGLLHDLGKALIPLNIINKKGELTREEYQTIKKHPVLSYDIIVKIRQFEKISKNVLYHHERYDGLGYPEGLKGGEIPLASRIIAVADSYDAMTSDRSYKEKISVIDALNEIEKIQELSLILSVLELL